MRPDAPHLLTPNERRAELAAIFAAIFAAGIPRLRVWEAMLVDSSPSETTSDSVTDRLEIPAETVLSVHNG